ncbi:hypothetical protein RHIZ404_200182 [Rhizobium sp. EC-SD404]|nr:hypothetical protein RHIZ404_200182 [Rhizobium sp. EC-SD404]
MVYLLGFGLSAMVPNGTGSCRQSLLCRLGPEASSAFSFAANRKGSVAVQR